MGRDGGPHGQRINATGLTGLTEVHPALWQGYLAAPHYHLHAPDSPLDLLVCLEGNVAPPCALNASGHGMVPEEGAAGLHAA